MDIYEFIRGCMEDGLDAYEAEREWARAMEERRARFIEEYENDPLTHEGWAQQDLIDLYRMER